MATPSADLKEIEIDREATIGLSALGDDFEVTSVYYYEAPTSSSPPPLQDTQLLPPPSSAPASRSATPSPKNL
jgi:hypothetical protein